MSNHFKKIRECLTKTLKEKKYSIEELLGDKIIVNKEEGDDDNDGDCYSILNNEETVLVEESERYDNHLFYEKRIKIKIPKKIVRNKFKNWKNNNQNLFLLIMLSIF